MHSNTGITLTSIVNQHFNEAALTVSLSPNSAIVNFYI